MLRFTVFLVVLFSGLRVTAQQLQYSFSGKNDAFRSEICILHCQTDSTNRTVRAQLEYLQTDSLLPSNLLIIHFSDCKGTVTEHTITAESGASVRIPELAPTAAPKEILGSEYYYQWRNDDCVLRNQLSGQSINAPDYYLNYGDKYARRFLHEIRPKLSEEGQLWVDNTLLLLQITTECLLANNAHVEQNGSSFRQQLFDQHTSVYETTGFFGLCFRDKLIITTSLDFRDIVSQEGFIQVKTIAVRYLRYLVKRKINTAFPRLCSN